MHIGSSPSTHPFQQLPVTFPDNLDELFSQAQPPSEHVIPFRDLPIDDYLIRSTKTFKTKDKRDCTILFLTK